MAAAGAHGPLDWRPCDDRPDLHPRASASISSNGRLLGYAGLIHPDVAGSLAVPGETALFEIDRNGLLERFGPAPQMRPLTRFPYVARDMSLVVGEDTLAGEVYSAVAECGETLVETVLCFDEYLGEGVDKGSKALAFSITYRAADRTLTDEEVTTAHQRLLAHVTGKLGARVRA